MKNTSGADVNQLEIKNKTDVAAADVSRCKNNSFLFKRVEISIYNLS